MSGWVSEWMDEWMVPRCQAEKAMAPHYSALAWRTAGTGEPVRLLSVGSHRVGHD